MNFKRLGASAFAFVSTMFVFATTAFAQNLGAADNADTTKSAIAIAVGFGLGLAAVGGALGQGKAAAAALEGIGRNPAAAKELLTPLLLSLAIIESLVIYSLVISFILIGKL
jgi:F-type H+-transporting ATPase subunit c